MKSLISYDDILLEELEVGTQALPDNSKYNLLNLKQSNVPWSTLRKMDVKKFMELFYGKSLIIWVAAEDLIGSTIADAISKSAGNKNHFCGVRSNEDGTILIIHSLQGDTCKIAGCELKVGSLFYNWDKEIVSSFGGWGSSRDSSVKVEKVIELFGTFTRKVYNNSARLYVIDDPTYNSRGVSGFCFKSVFGDFRKCIDDICDSYKKLNDEVKSFIKSKAYKENALRSTGRPYIMFTHEYPNSRYSYEGKVDWTIKRGSATLYVAWRALYDKLPHIDDAQKDNGYWSYRNCGNAIDTEGYSLSEKNYSELEKRIKDFNDARKKSINDFHVNVDRFLGKIQSNPVPQSPAVDTPIATPEVSISDYISPSGRSAQSKEQADVNIFDVYPNGVEQTKALKLLTADKKSVDPTAYAKFLKLSNTKLKVCNRTFALLQHISNNGGDIKTALETIRSSWTGYFTLEQIFGSNLSDIDAKVKELEEVLD